MVAGEDKDRMNLHMAMYRIPCLQQSSFYCIKKFSPNPESIPVCDCIIPAMD